MKSIILKKVEDGIQPPTGNGFPIFAHAIYHIGMSPMCLIDTGLEFELAKDQTLEVRGAFGAVTVSWTLGGHRLTGGQKEWPEGRLLVVAYGSLMPEGEQVGTVYVIKRQLEIFRFMQFDPEGGRIVRGDAQVASSTENRESES